MQFTLLVALAFSIVVAVFAVQNATPVTVTVLNRHYDTSLVIVILISVAVGALGAGLFGLTRQVRLSLKLRSSNAKASRLEEQLRRLQEAGGGGRATDDGREGHDVRGNREARENTSKYPV